MTCIHETYNSNTKLYRCSKEGWLAGTRCTPHNQPVCYEKKFLEDLLK